MSKDWRARSVLACALLLATSLCAADATQDSMVFPGDSWEFVQKAELGQYGWDAEALDELTRFIADNSNTTGVVVAERGRVVYSFGDVAELSIIASVRKSILSILYGTWVEQGVIDLDATLAELGIDDVGGLLPIEKEATVEHLLTSRSGVYHPAANGGDHLADAPSRGSQRPGEYTLYSNWDFNAAGAVFEQLTGRNIYDEFDRQLAAPLQLEDWDRSLHSKSHNPKVSRYPAYHFYLSTRDMARIGHLMLNQGRWDGVDITSGEWAQRIVSTVTPLAKMNPARLRDRYFGYGYMWWVWDGPRATGPFEGAYTGRGSRGQWLTVFPKLQLVFAHKTKHAYRRNTSWKSWHGIIERLLEARGVTVSGPYPWQ